MLRFLRETWELWYWAMFCPSKLQQRMNEWAPAEEKDGRRPYTIFSHIIFFRANSRFIKQYFFLLIVLTIPLALAIFIYGEPISFLLIPLVIMTAYSASFLFLPMGISMPLLFGLNYLQQPAIFLKVLNQGLHFLPPILQITASWLIGTITLVSTFALTFWFLEKNYLFIVQYIILFGVTLSVFLGSWVVNQSLLFTLIVSGTTGFLIFLFGTDDAFDTDDASGLVFGVTIIVTGVVAGSLAVVVAVSVVGSLAVGWSVVAAVVIVFGVAFVLAGDLVGDDDLVFLVVAGGLAGSVVSGAVGGLVFVVASVVTLVVAFGTAVSVASLVTFTGAIAVTVGTAVGMAGLVTCSMAVGVAVGVAVSMAVVATLPLPFFLLACWLVAVSVSPASGKWPGMVIAGILTALGFEHLSWNSFLAVPVILASYYRLLPDYLILIQISLLPSTSLLRFLHPEPLQLLRLLPPHTTELLWLPLPNHDRILAAAFRTDTSEALKTFQQMQASPLPGFKRTIKQASPQIVADQLAVVSTIRELVSIAPQRFEALSDEDGNILGDEDGCALLGMGVRHPIIPLLVPTLYPSDTELENPRLQAASPYIEAEISIMLPRLQVVARDVDAALKAGSAAIRERGLERILNNLRMLQLQLPRLGLKVSVTKRWQPVIERWQRVIELELEEQQKQSQGELLNPFQYGNPLRRDRTYLFKGRQAFADNIVRHVLDRNRPTLVLHGPRRFGKSSFLLNLPRLLPSDLLPIYLDMQSAAVTTDEAAFCQGLVRAISKDSRSQGIELPAIPQRKEFLDTPYIALEDWLEQAVPQLGDRRLLLNLDEFEKIGSAINEGRISLRLFDQLRHLIQHYDQLGFLFSGVQTLDELGPNWSSYFISVVPIEILYLKPSEAEDLLLNPDPEFTLRYDTGIVEEILTLTRCHPYLLQLMGWSLVKLANENHTQLVTLDLLQAAIPEAFTNGQPYFTNVWTEFTGTFPAEVKAGQDLLLALAQGNQSSSVTSDETVAARRRLLRYHVIESINGSDRFEVPLIERWVQERAIRN